AKLSAQDYLKTRRRRDELKRLIAEAMDGVDGLLTPTTETAAIPLAQVDEDKLPSRFTRLANILDMCALSLPNGFTAQGLPLSLQINCSGYEEALALRIGQAYQTATDWHLGVPGGLAPAAPQSRLASVAEASARR